MTGRRPGWSAGSYLLCATPRTGSTLLCHLLASTGVAGRPASYFREPDLATWAARWGLPPADGDRVDAAYVEAVLEAARTPDGLVGIRLMWGSAEPLLSRLAVLHPDLAGNPRVLLDAVLGPVRVVHLRRRDVVAQAVSWALAERTGHWQDGDPRTAAPTTPDLELVDALVATIREHDAAWSRWFAALGLEPVRLDHEDLVADPVAATAGVLAGLGLRLPAGAQVAAPDRRQADEVNAAWVVRYRAECGRPATPAGLRREARDAAPGAGGARCCGVITVRPARPADADDMAEVQNAIYRAGLRARPVDAATVRERYLDPEHRVACTVAEQDGRVVGFQSLKRAWPGNPYDVTVGWGIIGTHIRPDAGRHGLGRRLFAETVAAARAAGLQHVDARIGADNLPALAYYAAMGFTPYGDEHSGSAVPHRLDL